MGHQVAMINAVFSAQGTCASAAYPAQEEAGHHAGL